METPLTKSLCTVLDALSGKASIAAGDKLGHSIMMTMQRRRAGIDWLVDARSSGRVRPRIRRVLWWAIAELLWFDGVPAAAVVDTAVAYIKRRYSANEASYANALLRGLLRDVGETGVDGLFAGAPLHVRFWLPEFICRRWLAQFGEEETLRLAKCLQQPASTILRRRQWPACGKSVPEGLRLVNAPEWAPGAELYEPATDNVRLDDYMGGNSQFYIQDMATLLAPGLLAPRPGEDIADLCAAPGGKALVLGEMMQGRGLLFCADRTAAKLPRLQENLATLPNAVFECHDASTSDFGGRKFDGIMLDVPCSNTGVIRRKPDVRWNLTKESFSGLLELQGAILGNAARALKKCGRIVYSTCSLELEENMGQVNAFLREHSGFHLENAKSILPDERHDGAFAALIARE